MSNAGGGNFNDVTNSSSKYGGTVLNPLFVPTHTSAPLNPPHRKHSSGKYRENAEDDAYSEYTDEQGDLNPTLTNRPFASMSNASHISRQPPYAYNRKNSNASYYDGGSDVAGGASPRVTIQNAQVPMPEEENHVLNDIERQEQQVEGRKVRSASVASELNSTLQQTRPRRATIVTLDASNNNDAFQSYSKSKLRFRQFIQFADIVRPKLQQRFHVYSTVFLFLCFLSLSSYYQVTSSWFALYFAVIGIDCVTFTLDHFVFIYVIDRFFANRFETAYLLHGFNGPIGLLISILLIEQVGKVIHASTFFPKWENLLAGLTMIVLSLCVKNWYARKYYMKLLEQRFSDKLFKLETWSILLSELATVKPPKLTNPYIPQFLDVSNSPKPTNNGASSPTLSPNSAKYSTASAGVNNTADASGAPSPLPPVNQQPRNSSGTFNPMMPSLHYPVESMHNFQQRVMDVFSELVETTNKYTDEEEDDIDLTKLRQQVLQVNASPAGFNGLNENERIRLEQTKNALKVQIRRRKTFWELAAKMSASLGTLRIITYNGHVRIQRKFQARVFGQNLFTHLSRGNKIVVSHELIKEIFKEHDIDRVPLSNSSSHGHDEELLLKRKSYAQIRMLSKNSDKDDATFLFEEALLLLDPFGLGFITEEQCIAAMIQVYKEQRFAATSLNDYGELHQSLRNVIDFVFWLIMMVLLQSFLQLNLFNYILPFVTMLLTVSFALGTLLGNIFLATVFVFFMIPYDVGNKIHIGQEGTTRITGYVRSVSLLHTTINTTKNEVVSTYQMLNLID